ncbi:MAG TPA: DUF222 domain-containing protein, partial [Candidatus Limnocylindrales bacterium]|nr:DUF222 domain-containing protein [Candidatus Limnocylindrales bacterium]
MGEEGPDTTDRDYLDLFAAIARLRARDRSTRLPEAMTTDLIQLRRACDLLELEFSEIAAAFSETNEADRQGSSTPIDWIRHHCHMAGGQAAHRVTVGRALGSLTQTVQAVDRGEIGFAHLTVIARTEQGLKESGCPEAFDETDLLAQARELSVGRLWRVCDHVRHANDLRSFALAERAAVEARYLRLTTKDDGSLIINGWLDPTGGAAVRTALEPLARRDGADDRRDLYHRNADALVELSTFALDNGRVPQRVTHRPHLQVTTSLETLQGLAGAPAADLERGAPISSVAIRRLACDGTIRRVLLDPKSLIVDVGRARRVVTAATREALTARDRHCRWPGCDRQSSWSAAHHLTH